VDGARVAVATRGSCRRATAIVNIARALPRTSRIKEGSEMAKSQDTKKEKKKAPQKTPKEKKQAKKEKKGA
jgi:hypothetical protein